MNNNEGTPQGFGLGQLALALLGGAAAGAAVVYFTAPRAGVDSRRRIQATANDARDAAARLPVAVRNATAAAREAFEETLRDGAGA